MNRYWAFISLLYFASAQSNEQPNQYGPITSYAQAPLQTISLTPRLRSGFSLPENEFQFYSSLTAASIWIESGDYHADYYQNQLMLGGKWQASKNWQFDLNYRWNYAANNYLDGLVRDFHSLFGISQNGRDQVDNHQFNIQIPKYGIDAQGFQRTTIVNALTLYGQYQVLTQENYGLSIGGAIYVNRVNSGTFEGDSVEQSLQANYTHTKDEHTLFGTIGTNYRHSQTMIGDFPMKKMTLSLIGGYQYQWRKNHQIHLEYRWYQGAESGSSDFAHSANEFLLGYRYLMENSAIELSLVENVFYMDNSTDIAFSIGYIR